MFSLLNSYVAKANRIQNPQYGTKVLNFLLALSNIDKRDFGFVSTNLCSTTLIHVNRLSASNRKKPLIFYDKNNIIGLIGKQVANVRHYFGDKSMHVTMSLVVDATIIVRKWHIIRSHNKIIGGASPHH